MFKRHFPSNVGFVLSSFKVDKLICSLKYSTEITGNLHASPASNLDNC